MERIASISAVVKFVAYWHRWLLRRMPSAIVAATMLLFGGVLSVNPALADISQVDIGSFTNTGANQTTVAPFTVSAGANVLVVNVDWRTGTQQNIGNLPVITYNGVPLTLAAQATDANANYVQSGVYYQFNPTPGTANLSVNYGVGIVGGASAFDVFTLGGVDTNQAPDAYAGRTAVNIDDGGPVALVNTLNNVATGSWDAATAHYRLGTAGTLIASVANGSGTLITNGNGGAPANGNLWTADLPASGSQLTEVAGALLSNITSSSVAIQETGAGGSVRFTMAGAAFAPVFTAPTAAVSSWNGGATDNNWSSGNNWGGTAPASGNALTFSSTTRTSPVNDTTAGTAYGGIRFDSTAGSFTLSGNDIGLAGDIVNLSTNTQTINLNIALNAGNGSNPNPYVTAASGNIVLGGSLSGSQGLILNGPGIVTLGAANTHTGTTSVINGTLRINNANSLQSSPLVMGSAGTLRFGAGVGTFTLSAGLAGAGSVVLTDANSQPVTLVVPTNGTAGVSTTFAGNLSGSGGLTINGTGTVTLSGTSTNSGPTLIQSGTLHATNSFRYYRFTVNNLHNVSAANSVQMSELEFFDANGNYVPAAHAKDFTDNEPNEIAPNLNDANLSTKWLDFGKVGSTVTFDFGSPQALSKYNLATANDAMERDPTGWTISGSNDGVNFTNLDVETNIVDPTDRMTWYNNGGTGTNPTSFFNMALPSGTAVSSLSSTSAVVMSSNTTLDITNGSVTIGSLADAPGNPTGLQVLLGGGTLMTGNDNTNTTFSGSISGTGGNLTKVGTGIFTLAGANTYSGATNVAAGTLRLASGSSLGNTNIFVGSSAKLSARPNTGTTISTGGSLTLNSGSTFDMSGDGNAGTLSVAGGLNLNNNVTLNFDIGTSGSSTVTDLLAVGGAAAGSGTATINITGFGAANLSNGRYNLITAGASGLLTESFALGTPTVTVNGTTYDLTLVSGGAAEQLRVAGPSTTGNWTQTASGTFSWGEAGNWSGGTIPGSSGDIANFGAATANSQIINLDQARALGVLNFNNTGGGNYTIGGNGFNLTLNAGGAGAIVTNSNGNNIISAPVTIGDVTIINAVGGTSLTLSGVVSSSGPQSVTIGTGGTGTVVLSNTNTFSGGLDIASGNVSIPTINNSSTSGPLGTQTAVTLGAPGNSIGTLEYTGASSSTNMPFVAAAGGGGSIQVDSNAAVLTLSGSITGSGSFGTSGPGTVVLENATNSFSGGLNLNSGTLRAGNANSGVIGSGSVTFGASNTPTLDLNGNSPTTGLLSGSGANGLVTNSAASGTATLTLSGAGSATYHGSINKGATADVALALTGGGTQTLTGSSNFTGGIAVQNGTLRIGNGASLSPANSLTLGSGANSGVLALGDGNGAGNLTVSSLALSGTGTSNAVVGGATSVSNLTISNTSPASYPTLIIGGAGTNQNNVSITAGGTSSITLSKSNTYGGGSIVNTGATLVASPSGYGTTPAGTGALTLSGGTLSLAGVPNGSGLVASFYVSPPNNINNADPAFTDLPTMTAHFAGGTPRISVATTTGGKADLDFSNNAYGGAAPFNASGATTAAYGFAATSNYEATFTGYVKIATAGAYTFSTTSDDGSVLFIDGGDGTGPNGLPAVNNNMYQGATTVTSNSINLTAGLHAVTIGYYQGGGGQGLLITYNGPDTGGTDATLPNSALMLTSGAFMSSQSYANNLVVTSNSTINITNSLSATLGNASLGAATLSVASSDATNSSYSLTLGTTTLTGNAEINVANSAGGGSGTVTLGSVTGGFSLAKSGPGTLVLSAVGSYSGGTTVSGGTVQANTPGSLGAGAVTLNNGATLKLIANPSTLSPVNGFNGGTNWTVNSVTIVSAPFTGDTLTLTDGQNSEARSAFFNTPLPIVYGNHGFTASFTYQDVNPPAGGGADGITFTLQNDLRGPTAIGGAGGGLGYGTDAAPPLIVPSVAYELNVYNGHVQGTNFVNSTTNPGTNNFNATGAVNVASGDPIQVTLVYDPVAHTITETDKDTTTATAFTTVYNVGDLTDPITGVGGTSALIGFTGGTGGVNSTQTISGFTYSVTPATASENIVVSPTASATVDVTTTASGNTVTMGTLTIGAGGTLNKVNTGTLEVTGAANLAAGASINVNAGSLKMTNNAGAATVGSGVTATVASGATLELAGTVSNLSSPAAPADRVHIVNNSKQSSGGSLLVSGPNQQVGAIDGTGDTVVATGANLTANHIVQSALVIGGASGTPSLVTIAASDASGNPTALSFASVFGSLTDGTSSVGIDSPSGSVASGGSTGGLSSLNLGGGSGFGGSAAVPEPSTLVLLALGGLACCGAKLRRRLRREEIG
jgi:autotransporter-associated beta strand protein